MLRDYVIYETPVVGLFKVTGEYDQKNFNWYTQQKEAEIIGEDKDSYIYRFSIGEWGEYEGETVVQKRYLICHGFHKSLLLEWKQNQLNLF